jgi:hypothetical protein
MNGEVVVVWFSKFGGRVVAEVRSREADKIHVNHVTKHLCAFDLPTNRRVCIRTNDMMKVYTRKDRSCSEDRIRRIVARMQTGLIHIQGRHNQQLLKFTLLCYPAMETSPQ